MAILNPQDEAFFEQLSGANSDDADESTNGSYKVELARARTSGVLTTASTATEKPKLIKTKDADANLSAAEAEDEETWSEGEPEGKLTGWISYTWSRSLVQTDGVNNSETYPSNYDSPNDLCINVSYDDHHHWALSAVWYYRTGSPVSTPTGFYYNNGYSVPIYGDRNNSRLPDYHRLDLSVTYHISNPDKRFQQSIILTLYNAYGRYNPFSVSFNRTIDSNGNLVVPANTQAGYQLVPTSISVAGIIPSINYQFKF